ncbi:MAG: hypothetical protein ABIP95_07140, partial [Pelobium sp.]
MACYIEFWVNKNLLIMEEQYINLSPEEMENPMLVLEQLFDACSISEYQQEIWELLKASMSKKAWNYLQSPGMVPQLVQSLLRGMECCRLLLAHFEEAYGVLEIALPANGSAEELELTRQAVIYRDWVLNSFYGRVQWLSAREVHYPMNAVKAFFAYATFDGWKEKLKDLAEHALDTMSIADALEDGATMDWVAPLNKMMEAGWLLFMEAHPEKRVALTQQQYTETLAVFDESAIISRRLYDAFHGLIKTIPTRRLNRHLRKLCIGYLQGNPDAFPLDF